MTEASLAMVIATLFVVALNVWLLRRRAPVHDLRGRRDHALAMGSLVVSSLGAPLLLRALCIELTHGSELSNIGDGLLLMLLMPLHFVGWMIVMSATVRRGSR